MKNKEKDQKYVTVYDRHTRKYGVRKAGEKEWWIEPKYDEIEAIWEIRSYRYVWIKQNGRYGYLDLEKREVTIPCEYGFPLYFSEGYAIAWKDYKAGVVNEKHEVVIPFIYDEVESRLQYVGDRIVVDKEGNEHRIGPRYAFRGFACFTNEGGRQAYDENVQPCEFEDWEQSKLNYKREWCFPENADRTVEEIEEIIRKEYHALLDMEYDVESGYYFPKPHNEQINNQLERIRGYIYDRNYILGTSWVHNYENAQKISRVNDLLMRAVAKAVKLGKKTAKSLQWMEKVSNRCRYEVEFYVHPEWKNDKSAYDYVPKEKNKKKEKDRLEEQSWYAEEHIWNIILNLSKGEVYKSDEGFSLCFYNSAHSYVHHPFGEDQWDFRSMIGDDGQTWDEGIHYPAYMDVYFTKPFHYLFFEHHFALADLININDFRVTVEVKLEVKESDKLPREKEETE